jgi:hypothetical protein
MKHLKKFEAFSDYTNAIKDAAGKIGRVFGIESSKDKENSKIYNSDENRDAALALIFINGEIDKYKKLSGTGLKEKDFEAEQMLMYYIDMLPEKKEDLIMLGKLSKQLFPSGVIHSNPTKDEAFISKDEFSKFKVPKFDKKPIISKQQGEPRGLTTPFYPGGDLTELNPRFKTGQPRGLTTPFYPGGKL